MTPSGLNTVRVLFNAAIKLIYPNLRVEIDTALIEKDIMYTPFRERTHGEFDNLVGERSSGLPFIQIVIHPRMLKLQRVEQTLKEVVKKLHDYVEWN